MQLHMNAQRLNSIDISAAQIIRKFALAIVILVGAGFAAISDSIWESHSSARELIEFFGLLMIVACIVLRIYCSLYIGGRKISSLVVVGPYSVCRNPLYAASIVGAIGIGAQQGSVTLGLMTGGVVALIFYLLVLREEQLLSQLHGTEYELYRKRVPRFVPNFSLWRDVKKIEIEPRYTLTTALDGCVILLWLPLAEALEHIHNAGFFPVLLRLP
jgi:protein-S-isoprenylcysteine O-methyltransferase Ste14